MRFLRFLRNLALTPSAFDDDPCGFLRNQIGHGWLIGGLPVLIWGPLALVVTIPGYAIFEVWQWRARDGEFWDCVEDFAHFVTVGLAIAFAPVVLVSSAAFLLSGYARRAGW
jgi:hypothetical protein